jgi:hypothetical protein
MITGLNTVFEHDGRAYHIQAEDLGEAAAAFEVRVYDGGTVLWRKRLSYAEDLDPSLPRADLHDRLRARLEKTLHTVKAAIAKGKLA